MFSVQRTKHWERIQKIYIHITLCLYFLIFGYCTAGNTALLSGTLRTFQVHACDGEELKLECLPNTVINIYLVQYGSYVPSHLCPVVPQITNSSSSSLSLQSINTSQFDNKNDSINNNINNNNSNNNNNNTSNNNNNNNNNNVTGCVTSDSLRYLFLKKVEQGCREQRICKFMISPESFDGIDPCPGVRKYSEVAYKCRPSTFYNKIVCGGDKLQLKCQKSSRIVIFSAMFGSTATGVPECPQLSSKQFPSIVNPPFPKCQVSYATEIVMSSCHSKKKCTIDASINTFGDPACPKTTTLHLKVVYTCVPKEILKELHLGNKDISHNLDNSMETSFEDNEANDYNGFVEEPRYVPETLESQNKHISTKLSSGHFDDLSYKESLLSQKENLFIKPTKKSLLENNDKNNTEDKNQDQENANCTVTDVKVIGFISDWISAVNFLKRNTERFILYLLVSICGSLMCFLMVLSSRLYIQKKRVSKKVIDDFPTCTPFGALSDQNPDDIIDQLDGVTTLTEPLNHSRIQQPRHHTSEFVRYGSRNTTNNNNEARSSTIRRQGSDTNPISLARSLNNYYYS